MNRLLSDGEDGDSGLPQPLHGLAAAPCRRLPSVSQLVDWCSLLCDAHLGWAEGCLPQAHSGDEHSRAACRAMLSAVSCLLSQHLLPVSQRSQRCANVLRCLLTGQARQQQQRPQRQTAEQAALYRVEQQLM